MELPGVGGSSGSIVAAVLLLTAGIGGSFGAFFHGPLLYYDARPAYVTDEGLSRTDFQQVNATDANLSFKPIPLVELQARTWISVYATGLGTGGGNANANGGGSGGAGAGNADGPGNGSAPAIDPANSSLVAVFSMSALKLGPISVNPLVYAADPRLLDASGVLIEYAEQYLPSNVTDVTDVSVESGREVTMLGQETRMTRFNGTLVLSNDTTVDVRIYVARVVKGGELVVAFGIAPASADRADGRFATLVEHVRLVEWGQRPPEPGSASTAPAVPVRR